MPSRPLTQAELNAMPRVTPTSIAEEVYHANRLKQNQPRPIGPAGLALPGERAIFRPTIDGDLLNALVRRAGEDHIRHLFSPEEMKAVRRSLCTDFERRYPPADMAVLRRYGFASEISWFRIEVYAPEHSYDLKVDLLASVLSPKHAWTFAMDMGGSRVPDTPHVPPAAEEYCRRTVMALREKKALFGISGWPLSFRTQNGRYPRWAEIERHRPAFGAWMADQRANARQVPA